MYTYGKFTRLQITQWTVPFQLNHYLNPCLLNALPTYTKAIPWIEELTIAFTLHFRIKHETSFLTIERFKQIKHWMTKILNDKNSEWKLNRVVHWYLGLPHWVFKQAFDFRVNFGLAVERAKAMIDIPIEIVTVGEDTALTSADRWVNSRLSSTVNEAYVGPRTGRVQHQLKDFVLFFSKL